MRAVVISLFVIFISVLVLFTSMDTITIFSGTHYLIDISSDENNIKCIWCHSWVQNELNHSSVHSNFKCEECHRITITSDGRIINYAVHNITGSFPGNQSHAAYTPRCLDCHGGNGIYYNDSWVAKQAPPAPSFNETDYGGNYSAHKRLVLDALNSGVSYGENEACLACHTNYSIELIYSYFWNISYSMPSGWSITSFSYNGTRNYTAKYESSGAKHEFLNVSSIDCTSCHRNIYDALVNGTFNSEDPDENFTTHAPISTDDDTCPEGDCAWYYTDEDPTLNAWFNFRYHFIYPDRRAERVNNSYCFECHNVARFAAENPGEASTYDLSSVINDTNSRHVHAAEALTCATCHGTGKTKESDVYHQGNSFADYVANNFARTVNGDICMGCHEAAVHPDSWDTCSYSCHTAAVDYVYIDSEPSGYLINSENPPPPPPQVCQETWQRTTDDGVTVNFSLGTDSFIWTFDKSGTSSKSVELYFDNDTTDGVFYGVESDSYWCTSGTPADCYCIMSSPGDYSNCRSNPSEIGVSIVKSSGHVEFHMSNSLNATGTVKMLGSHVFGWYDYTEMDGDPIPTGSSATPNGTVYVGSCYLPDENGW